MIKETKYTPNGLSVPIHCQKYKRPISYQSSTIILHYHEYCEMVFVHTGTCHCIIGANKYTLEAGDTIFVNSEEPHFIGFFNDTAEYVVIKFLPSIIFSGEHTLSEYSYLLLLQNYEKHRAVLKSSETEAYHFGNLFNKILNEYNDRSFGYELALRTFVMELFLYTIRVWKQDTPELATRKLSTANELTLQKAIEYIKHNFSAVSQTACAKALNVSTSHLSRLFKNGLNMSFSSFVNSVKLAECEKLLLTTDMSITEIGAACGFSTTSYFISIFGSTHHITPHKYRASNLLLSTN